MVRQKSLILDGYIRQSINECHVRLECKKECAFSWCF